VPDVPVNPEEPDVPDEPLSPLVPLDPLLPEFPLVPLVPEDPEGEDTMIKRICSLFENCGAPPLLNNVTVNDQYVELSVTVPTVHTWKLALVA
jgi:hypothetical protein